MKVAPGLSGQASDKDPNNERITLGTLRKQTQTRDGLTKIAAFQQFCFGTRLALRSRDTQRDGSVHLGLLLSRLSQGGYSAY
jgi:hypothetical protein